jgi:NitT/TauT family transport system ATP-binding protein
MTESPASTSSDPVALLRQVSKVFQTAGRDLVALEGVDLQVGSHEFVAVLGASGCGKSTLLAMIAGLVEPTEGTVERMPAAAAKGGTGMVFQDPVLLPWRTILGNVLLPTEMVSRPGSRERAQELIAHVGLGGFERSRPHQLSGGMQQRAALCRALMTEPRLLLMDEPFGALDAITREQMNLMLQRIWLESRCSVVLVTHSIEEAVFLADRIVVMTPRPGRVAEIVVDRLPRPRSPETYRDAQFTDYANHLRDVIVFHRDAA